MKNKTLIIIGAARFNKGSEMISSGAAMLAKEAGASVVTLCSSDIKRGENLDIYGVDKYLPRFSVFGGGKTISKAVTALTRMLPQFAGFITAFCMKTLIKEAAQSGLIIITAADNYDYSKRINHLDVIARILRKKTKAKMMLYDFSVKKENITQTLKTTAAAMDALTSRDSLSFKNLQEAGLKAKYYPDPAFIVPAQEFNAGIDFTKQYAGVNLSKLVSGPKGGARYNLIIGAYGKLIEEIISKDNLNALLIPHVMNGADLGVLKELYLKYKNTGKVFIVQDEALNGRQLKYIISKCRFFIGARTHATIAAYSSLVPTLVLGYSIKSRGIAKDLFGTDKNYVLPLNSLKETSLAAGFNFIYKNETNIKNKLKEVMPGYLKATHGTSVLMKSLMENK